MKDTVIVFARAPRLGTVKRRLAERIGARAALRFHIATTTTLLRRLGGTRRFRTVLAVTPDRARIALAFRGPRIDQGSGDLGRRMDRAFWRFRAGRVALIGSDIPDAGPMDIQAAFAALGRADAVFGPATDGGYWLVALGSRRPSSPFHHVRWSSPHALADTLRNFKGRRVGFLRVLQDVDTYQDLLAVSQNRRNSGYTHDRVINYAGP